jgi:hypothetical protein
MFGGDLHNEANEENPTPKGDRDSAANAIRNWCGNECPNQGANGEL